LDEGPELTLAKLGRRVRLAELGLERLKLRAQRVLGDLLADGAGAADEGGEREGERLELGVVSLSLEAKIKNVRRME